jgi:hypothetical protein
MSMALRGLIPLLAAALLAAALVLPPAADARRCRGVLGHRVVAYGVSCDFARDAARRYFRTRRTPAGWRCVKGRTSLSCGRGSRTFGSYRPYSRG